MKFLIHLYTTKCRTNTPTLLPRLPLHCIVLSCRALASALEFLSHHCKIHISKYAYTYTHILICIRTIVLMACMLIRPYVPCRKSYWLYNRADLLSTVNYSTMNQLYTSCIPVLLANLNFKFTKKE